VLLQVKLSIHFRKISLKVLNKYNKLIVYGCMAVSAKNGERLVMCGNSLTRARCLAVCDWSI